MPAKVLIKVDNEPISKPIILNCVVVKQPVPYSVAQENNTLREGFFFTVTWNKKSLEGCRYRYNGQI